MRGGIGIAGVLQIVFLVLKLAGLVGWSWLWVLAPFWISAGVAVLVGLVAGAVAIFAFVALALALKDD